MKARIVIGANYGDEGKGTVVARYSKNSYNVLNVLTNGGSQRGHSILTKDGSITFQHFGSGTYYGADNYYSCFFILNPIQFVNEYNSLIVKPKRIYRDARCRWSTPYDALANLISEQQRKRKASCGMGIWNTIRRWNSGLNLLFDEFIRLDDKIAYLNKVKAYYEKELTIRGAWLPIWNSVVLQKHFINDCSFMKEKTIVQPIDTLEYENLIFENGQGLLLSDTGKDTADTTPSNTGIAYSLEILKQIKNVEEVTAHYVTRPYLTRHGDGEMENHTQRQELSKDIKEDRTNHYNENQGIFRYGKLDISSLKNRINNDAKGYKFELELTHCDEMDRVKEFRQAFDVVNEYDTALI